MDLQRLRDDAAWHRERGELHEAAELYRRLADAVEADAGPEDPALAAALTQLGSVLMDGGDPAAARPVLERALRVREAARGPDHPATASARVDLASLLSLLGDYAGVRALVEPAIPVLEADGSRPLVLAAALNLLGQGLGAEGDFAALRVCAERAIAIGEALLEPGHPVVAKARNNLAVALFQQGDDAAARPVLEELLRMHEAAELPDPGTAAFVRLNLAIVRGRGGDWAGARALLDDAVPALRAVLPSGNPVLSEALDVYAQVLEKEAAARAAAGDPAGARALLERAIEAAEAVLGPDHLRLAGLWDDLGRALGALVDFDGAYRCLLRALEIRVAAQGPGHLEVATIQSNLAWVEMQQGRYAEARDRLEEALRVRRERLGPDHPEVATSLHNLGLVLLEAGDHAAARPLVEEALRIQRVAPPSDPMEVSRVRVDLGRIRSAEGDYAGAQEEMEEALRIAERALGADHPDTAQTACNLAAMLFERGSYAAARDRLEAALPTLERAWGRTHPDVTTSRHSLAAVHVATGEYARAHALLEETLEAQRESLGPDHPDVAWTLTSLAAVLRARGAVAEARARLEQALGVQERALGPEHPRLGSTLNTLGQLLFLDQGDADSARAHLTRAHRIVVAAYGAAHPEAAKILMHLALVQESEAQTRDAFREAHAAFHASLGAEHANTGMALANLAVGHWAVGDHAQALACAEEARGVLERVLGPGHPAVAHALEASALARMGAGDGPGALAVMEPALAILRTALGPAHPETTLAMMELSLMRHACGVGGALPLVLDALRSAVGYALGLLSALSLAEQHLLASRLRLYADAALTYSHGGALGANEHALVARRKGLLLHGLRQQSLLARVAGDAAHPASEAARELLERRRALAHHYRRGADADGRDDWRATYDRLTREKEALERALAGALPPGAHADPLAAASGVADFLAPGEALVDFYRYGHLAAWGEAGTDRYVAFVLAPGRDPARVELGEAGAVEDALERWRAAVLRGEDGVQPLGAFARAVWEPVAAALPAGVRKLWISPDGQLARFPWPLLAGEDPRGRLLSVVDSPRDLARLRATPGPAPTPGGAAALLLVGGVDFGPGEFGPLPGTRREVETLAALAGVRALRTVSLTRTAATRDAVMDVLPRMRYAHLATHGFFGEEDGTGEGRGGLARLREARAGGAVALGGRNPLVESALLLAGANSGPQGWLTAEELVGLDLGALALVVLSACNTGRGRELNGQGVMGLRASFLAAGARTLLMSLWEVPDHETGLLMERFYRGLWEEGRNAAEALRQAQAAVRAVSPAPYAWAAWVLAGEAW